MLLSATVATQLFVPRLLRRFGTTPVLVTSLVLMGVAAPGYALSDALAPVLAWSAVRGVGFGIVTVLGSTIVTHLVPRERRGEAIGVYGLAVAAPMVLLMPASVAVAEEWGYGWAFAVATLPLLGVPWAVTLGRLVDRTPSASITGAADEPHLTDLDAVRRVLRPTLVLFVVTMAGGAVMTFAPQLGFDGLWAPPPSWSSGSARRWRGGAWAGSRPARCRGLRGADAAALRRRRGPVRPGRAQPERLAAGRRRPGPRHPLRRAAEPHPPDRLRPRARARHPDSERGLEHRLRRGTATGAVMVGAIAAATSFGAAFTVVLLLLLAILTVAPRPSTDRLVS